MVLLLVMVSAFEDSVSCVKWRERMGSVGGDVTFGYPDDAGAGDWCGAHCCAEPRAGSACARHGGRFEVVWWMWRWM